VSLRLGTKKQPGKGLFCSRDKRSRTKDHGQRINYDAQRINFQPKNDKKQKNEDNTGALITKKKKEGMMLKMKKHKVGDAKVYWYITLLKKSFVGSLAVRCWMKKKLHANLFLKIKDLRLPYDVRSVSPLIIAMGAPRSTCIEASFIPKKASGMVGLISPAVIDCDRSIKCRWM
jgi:hypothetical protein